MHFVDDDLTGFLDQLFRRAVDMGHGAQNVGILHLGVDILGADLAARQHPGEIAGGAGLLLVALGAVNAGVQSLGGAPQGLIAHGAGQFHILHRGDGLIQGQQPQRGNGDGAVEHGQPLLVGENQGLQAIGLQYREGGDRPAVLENLSFSNVGHNQVGLHPQIAHGALAGGKGDQVLVQHLPDQLQGGQPDTGVALARVEDGHEHDRPGLNPVQRLAHRYRVGTDDVFLERSGVLGGDGVADVFTKAGGNAVNNAALLQKFVQQPAVGLDGLLHLIREFQLGTKLGYGDKFLQGGLAVGERDAGDASGGFYRQVHD